MDEKEKAEAAGAAMRWVGSWVQTDRSGHEAFTQLVIKKPMAAAVMHMLIARMGENNAVVISQKNLARLVDCHVNTVAKALKTLEAGRWIEIAQIGGTGTINAYIVNDRIAWHGPRSGIRHSLFSATVVVAEDDQPTSIDEEKLPLRQFPRAMPGERQLPSGEGEPPPSSPSLPGLEADMPELRRGGEAEGIGDITQRLLSRGETDDED